MNHGIKINKMDALVLLWRAANCWSAVYDQIPKAKKKIIQMAKAFAVFTAIAALGASKGGTVM